MLEEHLINKYSIQFISSPAAKNAFYARIENNKEKLLDTVNEVFNTYFTDDTLVEIDQIKLDIGTLSAANFSDTINARVKTLLAAEIEKLIKKDEFQHYLLQKRKPVVSDPFQLIENYLLQGFDTILQENQSFDPDSYILKLFEENSFKLASLIQKNENQSAFRRRLKKFKPETLAKLKGISTTLSAKLEKADNEYEGVEPFNRIAFYLTTGTFPSYTTPLNVSDIDFIVARLITPYGNQMALHFLKNLSNKAFVNRLSESLSFKTLYSVFERFQTLGPVLKEWTQVEKIVAEWGYSISSGPSHRLLFFEYLRVPPHASELKAQLVYNFLKTNTHLAVDQGTFPRIVQTIDKKNIPDEISFLLHHIKMLVQQEVKIPNGKQPGTSVEIIVSYFRSGMQMGNASLADLVYKQLKDSPTALSAGVKEVWKKEGVRHRMAYQLELSLLEEFTATLWSNHYTYTWWTKAVKNFRKTTSESATGNTPELIRKFHFLYFEFLSRYSEEQRSKKQFEEWMVLGLKNFGQDEQAKASSQHVKAITDLVFPNLPQAMPWGELPNSLASKEQSLQHQIDEINFLAQHRSSEEVQLYFEYQLEDGSTFKELFFQQSIHHTLWPTLWAFLSSTHLERMLGVLAPSQYQYIKELLEEIKLFLIQTKISVNAETIRRKSIIIVLQSLHNKNYSANKELLGQRLIQKLSRDDQSLFPVIDNEKGFPLANLLLSNYPKLKVAIENLKPEENQLAADALISVEDFNRVIKDRFPSISGFVFTYVSAIGQVFKEQAAHSEISANNLLVHVYSYLLKYGSAFSARAFVQSINYSIETHYRVEQKELESALLRISEENIQKGVSRFYALKEILVSQQYTTAKPLTPQNPLDYAPSEKLEHMKEALLHDSVHIKTEFSRKAIVNYITQGTISGKDEGGFESREQFLTFFQDFANEHATLFFRWMKELLPGETEIERFLKQENHEGVNFILQLLSGARHEEFLSWGQELEVFLHWLQPKISHRITAITVQKSLLYMLLNKERATVGLFSYLQLALQLVERQHILTVDQRFPTTLEKYKAEGKGSAFFVHALQNTEASFSSKKDKLPDRKIVYDKAFLYQDKVGSQALEELFQLVNQDAHEALQCYFEYHLEEGSAFRQLLLNKPVSFGFWLRIAMRLTDSLLNRLLIVFTPAHHAYLKQLFDELKLLALLNGLADTVERAIRKSYALLFHTIHESGFTASKEKISQILFRSLLSSEENNLKPVLEKTIALNPAHVQKDFPKLYAFMQEVVYDAGVLRKDGVVQEAASPEEIKKQIQDRFPGIADLVLTYLVAVGEYFSENSIHSKILTNSSFLEKIYNYLIENSHAFSGPTFIKEFNLQLAMAHAMYLQEVGSALFTISRKKIANGQAVYTRLNEILSSQGHDVAELPGEKEADKLSSSMETEYVIVHSKENFSLKDFNEIILARFPSTSDFVLKYLTALQESLVDQPRYSEITLKGILHKRLYRYLFHTINTFSTTNFVNEFTTELVTDYGLSAKETLTQLIKTVDEKISKGELNFAELKEILLSPKLDTEKEEKEENNGPFTLQNEYADIHSLKMLSFEKFKKAIQERFPSAFNFVSLYLTVLQESLINHPSYAEIVSGGRLYKKIYRYLFHKADSFSTTNFVKEFTSEIVTDYGLSAKETATALIKTVDEKIDKGDLNFTELREILLSQKLDTEKEEKQEKEDNNGPFALQNEYADIHSLKTLSFQKFKKVIQERFPSAFNFVSLYLTVLQESLINHPSYAEIVSGGRLYKKVYRYLFRKADSFSTTNFVKEFTHEIVADHHLLATETMTQLIKTIDEKIAKGHAAFSTLREILLSATYDIGGTNPSSENIAPKPQKDFSHNYLSSKLSPTGFVKIIQDSFPNVAGFVSTYLLALGQSTLGSIKNQDILSQSLYVTIYDHLLKTKDSFSAILFVRKMNAYISAQHNLKVSVLKKSLLKFHEEKNYEHTSRFAALKEILESKTYKPEDSSPKEPVFDLAPTRHQQLTEELAQHYQKIKFGFFHKALDHYISNGTFPDFAEDGFNSLNDFKSFIKAFFDQNKGEVFPIMKELLSKDPALDRLLKVADADVIVYMLRELSGDRYDEFLRWNTEAENFLIWAHTQIDRAVIAISLRKALFQLLLGKDRITVGLFSYLELAFESLKQQQIIVVTPDFPRLLERYTLEGKGNSLFIKALERMEFLLARKERDLFLKNIVTKKNTKKTEGVTLEGRLRITNAGIVMAGPFLYRYFDRLGMLENQKFKSDALACRGVQLLQFLATGSTEMQEHELVLNKILCGVKLDSYIENNFTITDEEKDVSESLLRGLLSNWNKIKSTSIDALREGFLMREGYLEQTELTWNLEVTRKAIDVLVDFIPWSYSLIKLAWMELSLATKWGKSLGE